MSFSLNDAHDLLLSGQYEQAEVVYRGIAEVAGVSPDVYFGLALSCYQQCRFDEAISWLERIPNWEDLSEVLSWRLECAYCLGEAQYIAEHALTGFERLGQVELAAIALRSLRLSGLWQEARDLVDRVMQQDVSSPFFSSEALLLQVDCPDGNQPFAIDMLQQLLQQLPDDEYLFYALIYALIRAGEHERAQGMLGERSAQGVQAGVHLAYQAWLAALEQDIHTAVETLAPVQMLMPNHPACLLATAYMAKAQGAYVRAAQSLARLVNGYEGLHRESREVIALLIHKLQNYPLAFKALAKLLFVVAGTADDVFELVWVEFQLEKYSSAMKYIEAIEHETGANADTRAAQAVIAASQGDFTLLLEVVQQKQEIGKTVFFHYQESLLRTYLGDLPAAAQALDAALQLYPDDLLLTKAQINILLRQEQYGEALAYCERVLTIYPRDFELRTQAVEAACCLHERKRIAQHTALLQCNNLRQYEAWLAEKLESEQSPEGLDDLAELYVRAAMHAKDEFSTFQFPEKAEEVCRARMSDGTDAVRFQRLLFSFLLTMERFDECFDLLVQPGFADASAWQIELANASLHLACDNLQQAEHHADRAYAMVDNETGFLQLSQLADIYAGLGTRHGKTIELYEKALRMQPDFIGSQYNLGHYYSFIGEARAADRYIDAGLAMGKRQPNRQFLASRWRGESLQGKTLLVWREQGIGDELYMSMYYRALIERAQREGGRVKIECEQRLLSLLRRSFPAAQIDPEALDNDMTRTDIDYHVPSFSLRSLLQGEYRYPAEHIASLQPRSDLLVRWRERLSALGPGLKIGICWRSSLQDYRRNKFYAGYDELEPLFRLPGVHWVNLNYVNAAADVDEIARRYGAVLHLWPDLDLKDDFEGVAALVHGLDLVISASSCPGVLARALGVATWAFMYGAEEPESMPSERNELNYPALTWRRHYTESYREVFARMAARITRHGNQSLLADWQGLTKNSVQET